MEFENQYLTYDEYLDFDEKEIGEMPFNMLEYKVRKMIDTRTQNRLKSLDQEEIPVEVKMCAYQLIKTLQSNNEYNKNVASENTDGYSVTYKAGADIEKVQQNEYEDIMFEYLYGVVVDGIPVLYLGV